MCIIGEFPAKIVDAFKQICGIDVASNLYTKSHYIHTNAFAVAKLKGINDFYEIDHTVDPNKPIPYKLTFDKELTDKLCMLVFVRSDGTTEWNEFKPHIEYYDNTFMVWATDATTGARVSGYEKKIDIKQYLTSLGIEVTDDSEDTNESDEVVVATSEERKREEEDDVMMERLLNKLV